MVRHQVIKNAKDMQMLEELIKLENLNRMKRFDKKLAEQEYKEELNTLFDPVIKPINQSVEQGNKILALTENQNEVLSTQNTLLGQTNKALEDQNILTREQNALTQDLIDQDLSKAVWSPSQKLQQIVQQMSAQTDPQLKLIIVDANKNIFIMNNHLIRFTNESILIGNNEYRLTDGLIKFLTSKNVSRENIDVEQVRNFLRDIDYSLGKTDKKSVRYKSIKSVLSSGAWKPSASSSPNWALPIRPTADPNLIERQPSVDSESEEQLNTTLYEDVQGEDTYISGNGLQQTYVFLSSDPDFLFDRLEVLIAESSAGNNNVLNEILAIGEELHRQKEVTDEEYQNFLTNFGEV